MAYGELKVDSITFTDGGSDTTITVSGLAKNPTFSGDIVVSGNISGITITGDSAGFGSVTGVTVTGTTANFVTVSGTTVTGDAAEFTSITGGTAGFTTVTGTTVTGTTANFATVSGTAITGSTAGFTTVTGTTVTGTTANFNTVSGTTVTGGTGNFTSVSATTATITSGIFASGTAAAPSVSVGSTDNGLYSPGTDQVALATNGTERVEFGTSEVVFNDGGANYDFRIEGDTNSSLFFVDASAEAVGIGTTSPSDKLHIDGGNIRITGSNPQYIQAVGINLNLNTDNQNIIFSRGGTTEMARFDSSSRLLVGTSTSRIVEDLQGNGPQGKIQIEATNSDAIMSIISAGTADAGRAGTLSLGRHRNSTVGGTPTIVQDGDTLGAICFAGGDGTDMRTKGASIAAQVDGTPGANDMPGRLVFSTTADGASSPTERMRIKNYGQVFTYADSVNAFAVATSGSTSATNACIYLQAGATGIDTGTITFRVQCNGDVDNTNNSYGAISDVKLKENIVDANSQWSDIKNIQVRNYNYKEETGLATHTQIGVIAQEIESISPGLVTDTPDVGNDGNDLGTVTKSVNYSVLYMKAVKALQEAMERIETLEASNADLLARVSALESA